MSEAATTLRQALIARALGPAGRAGREERRAAFENRAAADERVSALVDTVARHAWTVTDAHVRAAQAAGLGDDEVFELVVCAALGQSVRQLDAARAALDAATSPDPPGPGRAVPAGEGGAA